jgi:hypothetical protein
MLSRMAGKLPSLTPRGQQILSLVLNAVAIGTRANVGNIDSVAEQLKTTPGRLRPMLRKLVDQGYLAIVGKIGENGLPTGFSCACLWLSTAGLSRFTAGDSPHSFHCVGLQAGWPPCLFRNEPPVRAHGGFYVLLHRLAFSTPFPPRRRSYGRLVRIATLTFVWPSNQNAQGGTIDGVLICSDLRARHALFVFC